LGDRLTAYLPYYAPLAARLPFVMNGRNHSRLLARGFELVSGFSADRRLPAWRADAFFPRSDIEGEAGGEPVVLFADTFNRYFEPENLHAAVTVLSAAGYTVHHPKARSGERPLCCGRTFLSSGLLEKARAEMVRTYKALEPHLDAGTPVLGLEPSCLLTFRDEFQAVLPGRRAEKLARHALLFEEFIAAEAERGLFKAAFETLPTDVHLHGHCHQKAFGAIGAVEQTLHLVPGLTVKPIESSCCGMAGSFGYKAETISISKAMGELSVLPAVRAAAPGALIAADGFSCRHQIHDGSGREALHVARILAGALKPNSKTIA